MQLAASPKAGWREPAIVARSKPAHQGAQCLQAKFWGSPIRVNLSAVSCMGYRVWPVRYTDLRFGIGMDSMPERRDRLWLINAFAVVLLTLLGAAGEALGYDRMLKTNTVIPSGLHALRPDPDDAGSQAAPADAALLADAPGTTPLRRRSRGGLIYEGSRESSP